MSPTNRCPGRLGGEVAADQVGGGGRRGIGLGQATASPAAGDADDAVLAHQPLDVFAVDRPALAAQLDVRPG